MFDLQTLTEGRSSNTEQNRPRTRISNVGLPLPLPPSLSQLELITPDKGATDILPVTFLYTNGNENSFCLLMPCITTTLAILVKYSFKSQT